MKTLTAPPARGRELTVDELDWRMEAPDWALDVEFDSLWCPPWHTVGGRRNDFVRAFGWALGCPEPKMELHWSEVPDVLAAKNAGHKLSFSSRRGHVPTLADMIRRRGRAVPLAAWCHIPYGNTSGYHATRAHAWVGWDGRVARLCGRRPGDVTSADWDVTEAVVIDDLDKAREVFGMIGTSAGGGHKRLRLDDLR